MSWSAAARRCSGSSRRASRPAYRRGCSVLTRPSIISGKPVKSSIARTSRPDWRSATAVPPVETSSTPSSASPRAKSTIPRLSETDSSARRTLTSPGSVVWGSVGLLGDASAMWGRIGKQAVRPWFQALRRGALTANMPTRPSGRERVMADTGEGQIKEAEEEMSTTADELAERSDQLEERIESTKQDWARVQADDSVPTAAGDWEESEPDVESDDPAGFDDPENVDLD